MHCAKYLTPTWIHYALCRIEIRAHKATDDAANIYAILQKLLQSWLHEDYTHLFIIAVFYIDPPPPMHTQSQENNLLLISP